MAPGLFVYINTLYEPFEIRGRHAYLAFGASLSDFYTAPRSHEILGIDALTPTMACLRLRVTVGEVSVLGLTVYYAKNGRLVEMIDVIDDRPQGQHHPTASSRSWDSSLPPAPHPSS